MRDSQGGAVRAPEIAHRAVPAGGVPSRDRATPTRTTSRRQAGRRRTCIDAPPTRHCHPHQPPPPRLPLPRPPCPPCTPPLTRPRASSWRARPRKRRVGRLGLSEDRSGRPPPRAPLRTAHSCHTASTSAAHHRRRQRPSTDIMRARHQSARERWANSVCEASSGMAQACMRRHRARVHPQTCTRRRAAARGGTRWHAVARGGTHPQTCTRQPAAARGGTRWHVVAANVESAHPLRRRRADILAARAHGVDKIEVGVARRLVSSRGHRDREAPAIRLGVELRTEVASSDPLGTHGGRDEGVRASCDDDRHRRSQQRR